MKRTKVVLVAGSPRGGTTIANMVLGQHPQIFATGSMRDFPEGGRLFDHDNICSCGQPADGCPFWTEIRQEYLPFQHQHDRDKVPKLFAAMARVSGRTFIGDVTHNLQYANYLLDIPGLDVHLVHIVRNGHGVVFSRIREDYRSGRLTRLGWRHFRRVIRVSRHWARHVHQFTKLEKRLGERAVRVNYDHLCRHPAAALRPVGQCLGIDFDAIGDRLGRSEPLHTIPHLIRGNPRLRQKKDVVLRYDSSYRTELSLLDSMLLQVVAHTPMFRDKAPSAQRQQQPRT